MRCYFSFCELRGNPPFPARVAIVVEWSSLFNPGGPFRNYVNYLKKACFFLDQPVRWITPAVTNLVKGLKLAGKAKLRFPNFIDSSLTVKIINRESRKSEFAQLAYVSFLFALRVPSEALTLVRSYKSDDITQFLPQAERALIGLKGLPGEEKLVLRFNRRKNLPQGCIMTRPCFCQLSTTVAHQLCPVHFSWPLIRARVKSGAKLFPNYYDTKSNNTIKAVLAKLGIANAHRYSSHGFRRGAANELKSKGSQWPTVATLGEWRSLAFTGYVYLTP